jgi:hypothetical protein
MGLLTHEHPVASSQHGSEVEVLRPHSSGLLSGGTSYLLPSARVPLMAAPGTHTSSRGARPTCPVRRSLSSHAISSGGSAAEYTGSDNDSDTESPASGQSLQLEPAAVAVARTTSRPGNTGTAACHLPPLSASVSKDSSAAGATRVGAAAAHDEGHHPVLPAAPAERPTRAAARHTSTALSPVLPPSSCPSSEDLRLPKLGPAAHLIRGVARLLGM